ncbi:hypothetical protein E2562_013646 [Oryza meyeriana var. granulata]|uniref:Uncharacterized protein n=1 Tax=Oryza meyeriana var. granulata TaxID=110450 RepID=A0A6G1BJS2_9ORYZ|nr:hypothetical protein E2562_013646 [Oryza meyeriana var. granulata]
MPNSYDESPLATVLLSPSTRRYGCHSHMYYSGINLSPSYASPVNDFLLELASFTSHTHRKAEVPSIRSDLINSCATRGNALDAR